jgi:general secretion pathway protein K
MSRFLVSQEKGMALLIVVVVVSMLSVLLTEFAFSSFVDLRLAQTYRDSTQAYYLARGGIRAGQMLLQEGDRNYDARSELWGRGVSNFPVGDGSISIAIEDLDSRLSINALVTGNNPQPVQKARFIRLFTELGLSSPGDLAAALIDWLDTGDEVYELDGAMGAESSYYRGLDPSYQARNAAMVNIDELSLVKGFTPEVVKKIRPYVTLYGDMHININTAPPEVIATLYYNDDQPLSLDDAGEIVAARDLKPFGGTSDFIRAFPSLAALLPVSSGLNYSLKFTSDWYRIHSQAWINDGTRMVTAVVRKSSNQVLSQQVD